MCNQLPLIALGDPDKDWTYTDSYRSVATKRATTCFQDDPLISKITPDGKFHLCPIITPVVMQLPTPQSLESLPLWWNGDEYKCVWSDDCASGADMERCWLGLRQAIVLEFKAPTVKLCGHRAHWILPAFFFSTSGCCANLTLTIASCV